MKMNRRKHGVELRPGTYVQGKWHHEQYLIIKKLGSGTVGTVYLCEVNGKRAALKISEQSTSMTVEVNVLKALNKVQGNRLGPYLLAVDDWRTAGGKTYSFYVMEYLAGQSMEVFVRNNGSDWIGVFLFQLLDDLDRLHKNGWVFGDLKTENLLVLSSPPRIRWIDVGGTTQMGRAVKEYTEFHDRGYWGLGTRKAEPSYDLFALVMVLLTVFYPSRFLKTTDPEQIIFSKIDKVQELKPYKDCLKRAVLGKYSSSAAMKKDLISVLYSRQRRKLGQQNRRSKKVLPFFIESGGILLLATSYYIVSLLV